MDGRRLSDHQWFLTAGVGQVASPFQAAWIFTAAFNHLIDNGFCAGDKIPPKQILGCVAMYLFKLRDEWFGPERTLAMEMFQEALEKFLDPGPPPSLPAQADSTFQDITASQHCRY